MNRVLSSSSTKKPLMPCHPARAHKLLTAGHVAVYRAQPCTLILKDRTNGEVRSVEIKIDPGRGVAVTPGASPGSAERGRRRQAARAF